MKKLNKKAFTIVELVIVIAIIAILAAVLIPTFISIVNMAKVSKDTQLIRNLNTALTVDASLGNKHTTMQSALDVAEAAGYDVARINSSADNNEILWDSRNDLFCYLPENADKPQYIPESNMTDDKRPADIDYWRITADASLANGGKYSVYYIGTEQTIDTTVGFDAGTQANISTVTYKGGATAQSAVLYIF